MKTIYKFPLASQSSQEVFVPSGTKWLCAHEQNIGIYLWGEVEPDAEKESCVIEIFGTGHTLPEGMGISRQYIGTAFVGDYVWHVYERLT